MTVGAAASGSSREERNDGQGYPRRLAGVGIPAVARMVAIADAFDAMTGARPYRGALTKAEAIATLRAAAGRQFDPDMTEAFIELADAGVLDGLIGFSDFGTPLVLCPHCGPVIAVPRMRPADFQPRCTICAGDYQLTSRTPSRGRFNIWRPTWNKSTG